MKLSGWLAVFGLFGCEQTLELPDRGLAPNVRCKDGHCQCVSPWTSCDGGLSEGCHVDTLSDPENCGACGQGCLGGACVGGYCTPYAIAKRGADFLDPKLLFMELCVHEEKVYLSFGNQIASADWNVNAGPIQTLSLLGSLGASPGDLKDLDCLDGTLWWTAGDEMKGQVCRLALPDDVVCAPLAEPTVRLALRDRDTAYVTRVSTDSPLVELSYTGSVLDVTRELTQSAEWKITSVGDVAVNDNGIFAIGGSGSDWRVARARDDFLGVEILGSGVERLSPLAVQDERLLYVKSENAARGWLTVQSPVETISGSVALVRDMALASNGIVFTSAFGAIYRARILNSALEVKLLHTDPERTYGPVAVVTRAEQRDVALFYDFYNDEVLRLALHP